MFSVCFVVDVNCWPTGCNCQQAVDTTAKITLMWGMDAAFAEKSHGHNLTGAAVVNCVKIIFSLLLHRYQDGKSKKMYTYANHDNWQTSQ